MLRGLTTARFHASDLAAAKLWYTELLGVEPYFERPGYVEFRIGDYQHELGLVDSAYVQGLGKHGGTDTGPSGTVAYWHVDDVQEAVSRVVGLGAEINEPVRKFGDGFVGASVVDPFGNVLGLMQNQHYLEILATRPEGGAPRGAEG
ncbi:VOC family protein [Streptomyces sp. NBC_00059]|uniref:VOC family protein n=1 Tax=Streptomyces sp. NBC_00059 TaxID=2975635 RepID=UPI00224D9DE8|nr:VOC family protein [Streptomyces sp. NBC_00059]MCX5412827.1 VOC family protein [Streptomyces sp. NBC_00059]